MTARLLADVLVAAHLAFIVFVVAGGLLVLRRRGWALLHLPAVAWGAFAEISGTLTSTATIGIGAGTECHGQVLVLHDMLGVYPGKKARFVRNFMDGAANIDDAVGRYVAAVKDGAFPAAEHTY